MGRYNIFVVDMVEKILEIVENVDIWIVVMVSQLE